jgi:(p)ppGpp synthase/HD superfamily hydrolase
MNYSEDCKYSTRLISKLESLDNRNLLDFILISKAIYWARKYHGSQLRKSGEHFYTHPLEVAYMVSDHNLKTDVIVASILHDIVEDTEVTAVMICDDFGWRIAQMVDRLTRDRDDGSKLSVKEIINNAHKVGDKEVLLIKLIDRLHNIQTIECMGDKKIKEIINETVKSFLICAIHFENIELEQLLIKICLQTTFPEQYLIDNAELNNFAY